MNQPSDPGDDRAHRFAEPATGVAKTTAEALAAVYDAATVRAIERSSTGGRDTGGRRGGHRRRNERASPAASLALTHALMSGVADAVRSDPAERRLEEVDFGWSIDPEAAVVVHFVPDDPRATVAVVRPWLLTAS